MSVIRIGETTTFVDNDPVDVEDVLDAMRVPPEIRSPLRETYAYVVFRSPENADYGLALVHLASGARSAFEEYPFVEIKDAEDYDRALRALEGGEPERRGGRGRGPEEWSPPRKGREALKDYPWTWEGPGVYDFRDDPPTRSWESVEAYELQVMEREAADVIDYMFQGDEWEKDLRKLLGRNL